MERNIANFSVLNVYAYGLAKLGAKASAGTSMIKIRDKMTQNTENRPNGGKFPQCCTPT